MKHYLISLPFITAGLVLCVFAVGCKKAENTANTNLPAQKTVAVNYSEVSFTLQMPEAWEELYPGFEATNTKSEREPLVILRSPLYDRSMGVITRDTETTGFDVYAPITYFNNSLSFSDWYAQHRIELVNQYGNPTSENNLSINGRDAKEAVFQGERIVDAVNNTTVSQVEKFVYIPLEGKVLQLQFEADRWLYDNLDETIKNIEGSVRITGE